MAGPGECSGDGSNILENQRVDSWSSGEGAAICEVQTKPTKAGEGSDLIYILTGHSAFHTENRSQEGRKEAGAPLGRDVRDPAERRWTLGLAGWQWKRGVVD